MFRPKTVILAESFWRLSDRLDIVPQQPWRVHLVGQESARIRLRPWCEETWICFM